MSIDQQMHSLEMQLRDCRELLNQTNQELAALGNERARLADENKALRAERDEALARVERLSGALNSYADGAHMIGDWSDWDWASGESMQVLYPCETITEDSGIAIENGGYARAVLNETPAQSIAHIRAAGAREALERAMKVPGFSGTVVRVDVMREIIEQMEGE